MVAIGLLLMYAGFIFIRVLGHPSARIYNNYDYFGAAMFVSGVTSVVSGLAVFAWRYLP